MSKKKKEEHKKRKQMIGFLLITLAFVFVLVLIVPHLKKTQPINSPPHLDSLVVPLLTIRHPLNGTLVEQTIDLPQVYGVMIDNHPDARSQSGLDQAFLVIEAPVEGGISRFLAFFSADQVLEEIGPVRSARPYFLDWNNELDALYVHVGGSEEALDDISTGGTFDLNQYWFGDSFWRSLNNNAPHNVFTSTERLRIAVEKRQNVPTRLYETWTFKDRDTTGPVSVYGFSLSSFSSSGVVKWVIDETSREYRRLQDGSAHVARGQIQADNVAVMMTDVKVLDSVGRRKIVTIGEGEAMVFQDGKMIEATWRKDSQSERLRFFDLLGKEIIWNAGTTWIEVIPNRSDVSILSQ